MNSHKLEQVKNILAKELFDVSLLKLTRDKKEIVSQKILGEWEYVSQMELMVGCVECIELLQEAEFEFVVITSLTNDKLSLAVNWLNAHELFLPIMGVGRWQSKKEIVQAMKTDVFVDDRVQVLQELMGVVRHLFLFSWQYNEYEILPKEIMRVHSWQELYDSIRERVVNERVALLSL